MKKLECSLPVDRMRTVEPFDLGTIGQLEPRGVQMPDPGVFPCNSPVVGNSVKVAPLDHKGSRGDQSCHLRIVERVTEIPFEDFVFARVDVAAWTA